jgi:hypothetical protein
MPDKLKEQAVPKSTIGQVYIATNAATDAYAACPLSVLVEFQGRSFSDIAGELVLQQISVADGQSSSGPAALAVNDTDKRWTESLADVAKSEAELSNAEECRDKSWRADSDASADDAAVSTIKEQLATRRRRASVIEDDLATKRAAADLDAERARYRARLDLANSAVANMEATRQKIARAIVPLLADYMRNEMLALVARPAFDPRFGPA